MSLPTKLDHCVIHVLEWERSNAFYRDVLGAELVARPAHAVEGVFRSIDSGETYYLPVVLRPSRAERGASRDP